MIISETTARLVEGYFDLQPMGSLTLKGIAELPKYVYDNLKLPPVKYMQSFCGPSASVVVDGSQSSFKVKVSNVTCEGWPWDVELILDKPERMDIVARWDAAGNHPLYPELKKFSLHKKVQHLGKPGMRDPGAAEKHKENHKRKARSVKE